MSIKRDYADPREEFVRRLRLAGLTLQRATMFRDRIRRGPDGIEVTLRNGQLYGYSNAMEVLVAETLEAERASEQAAEREKRRAPDDAAYQVI